MGETPAATTFSVLRNLSSGHQSDGRGSTDISFTPSSHLGTRQFLWLLVQIKTGLIGRSDAMPTRQNAPLVQCIHNVHAEVSQAARKLLSLLQHFSWLLHLGLANAILAYFYPGCRAPQTSTPGILIFVQFGRHEFVRRAIPKD